MKPSQYRSLRVISEETPYQVQTHCSDCAEDSNGTLHIGRCVWTEQIPAGDSAQTVVPAYVEGIGVISLKLGSVYKLAGSAV
jgi:hypothetical protein